MDHAVIRPAHSGGFIFELWHGTPLDPTARPWLVGHTLKQQDAVAEVQLKGISPEFIRRVNC